MKFLCTLNDVQPDKEHSLSRVRMNVIPHSLSEHVFPGHIINTKTRICLELCKQESNLYVEPFSLIEQIYYFIMRTILYTFKRRIE